MVNKLHFSFLDELFKLLFLKKEVVEICLHHFKYEFIPSELIEYKKIYKYFTSYYKEKESIPTYGILNQVFYQDIAVLDTLEIINKAPILELDVFIDHFEQFIRDVEFQLLNEFIVDTYNNGDKSKAIEHCAQKSKEILQINLREDAGKFLKVFTDFEGQQNDRRKEKEKNKIVPFGIKALDALSYGGMDVTDIALVVLRSGEGKSTWLRYMGFYAAYLGLNVLHFQLEGSYQEAFDKYTQIWTGQSYVDIKNGKISSDKYDELITLASRYRNQQKEVTIYCVEKFEEVTMYEIKHITQEYIYKNEKKPDLILIDSLDLLQPGDGHKYGIDQQGVKMRLQKVAQLMKNMSVELRVPIVTATQASNVPYNVWNDPDKVIDRSHIEGDKTLIKPFSFVFTGNQTIDEKSENTMRIYIDKLRNYKIEDKVIYIKTKFEKGSFYNPRATNEFQKKIDEQKKYKIKNESQSKGKKRVWS